MDLGQNEAGNQGEREKNRVISCTEKEGGYSVTPNWVFQNIVKFKLSRSAHIILDSLYHSSYEWKQSFESSPSFISERTGIHRNSVKKAIKELVEKKFFFLDDKEILFPTPWAAHEYFKNNLKDNKIDPPHSKSRSKAGFQSAIKKAYFKNDIFIVREFFDNFELKIDEISKIAYDNNISYAEMMVTLRAIFMDIAQKKLHLNNPVNFIKKLFSSKRAYPSILCDEDFFHSGTDPESFLDNFKENIEKYHLKKANESILKSENKQSMALQL